MFLWYLFDFMCMRFFHTYVPYIPYISNTCSAQKQQDGDRTPATEVTKSSYPDVEDVKEPSGWAGPALHH